MNIHPLWIVCILVRISIIFIIRYLDKLTKYKKSINNFFIIILLVMGSGFLYKGYYGSNNEIQINKVFWHETRYVHGVFFILAGLYLKNGNLNINSLLLFSDLLFSLSYRLLSNK